MTRPTYTSVLVHPRIRGLRRDRIIAAARAGDDLDPELAHRVRVIEYDVPDREGNGTGELIVLLTTMTAPVAARADELAAAYHERWGATRGRACGVNAQFGGRLCRVRSS